VNGKTLEEVDDLGAILTKEGTSTKEIYTRITAAMAATVDSLYLDYPLSRTSLYLEQKARSLGHLCTL